MTIQIEKIVSGRLRQNGYVVGNAEREAIIIDPGADYERTINVLEQNAWRPLAILNTHGHCDHIGAVAKLMRQYDLPFYLSKLDERLVRSANIFAHIFESKRAIEIPVITHDFQAQPNPLKIGSYDVVVFATPGHTPGSSCIGIKEHLFTGDTLLRGNVGRTDLPGGDASELTESMQLLGGLDEDFIIYPGHGRSSTIGEEKRTNISFMEYLQ